MKATDDPRIIASHPAPGAGVGLRSARPFGLAAFPGGTATIGRIGQAALRFAQRSLAAPLRYQQPELTWLDSFRLGRRPSGRIQPWRRRPASPAHPEQLVDRAPEFVAGADDWAAETSLSPMPFIQPPTATPSLARLARAITAAPAGSPALSLRRSVCGQDAAGDR